VPALARKRRRSQLTDARLQDELHKLSRKLFHLQDDERRLLAKELYDTAAQSIAAVILDLDVIGGSAELLNAKARQMLFECVAMARECFQEIRTFYYLLHPPMLDELGLISAIRIYVEDFSRRSGIRVGLELPDSYPKLTPDLEITLFHAMREGLANAQGDSESPWATVRMRVSAKEVRMRVENEAAVSTLREKKTPLPMKMGVGLLSVRERVRHFGGQLTLHSYRRRTILDSMLPVPRSTKASAVLGPSSAPLTMKVDARTGILAFSAASPRIGAPKRAQ